MEARSFSTADYAVFGAMLLASAAVGLYHGLAPALRRCFRSATQLSAASAEEARVSQTDEFLTAGGNLGALPVALSMLASFLSSITLIGQPAEVYLFGPQLWLFGIAIFGAAPIVGYIFIPLYHHMGLTSAYEYFGYRFNRKVQILASVLFTLQMVLFLALVLYAPALALHQVTGINTESVVSAMYVIVIFYTTLGGMKAVVWTDCFQVVVLFGAMIAVLVKGTIDVGGPALVWQRNADAQRTNFFDWRIDPTERYTVWSAFVGSAFLHMAVYGANQLQVQRYLTVKSIKEARKMLWINCVGWTLVCFLTVFAGMLIFAKYYDCDPLKFGTVKKPDQLFPLFVMETLGEYQGFPGVFVAGIFSAGLSTVSTGLNSLAAIWFTELDGTKFKSGLTENRAAMTVKCLALGFGMLSFALVFLVPYMEGLVPIAIALSGFFSGSVFGVFILGIFIPWANSAGAASGLLSGIAVVGYITIGTQIAIDANQRVFTPLPTSIENCNLNVTQTKPEEEFSADMAFPLYRISFLWYSMMSTMITVLVGSVVSWVFPTRKSEDRNMLTCTITMEHLQRNKDEKTPGTCNEATTSLLEKNSKDAIINYS